MNIHINIMPLIKKIILKLKISFMIKILENKQLYYTYITNSRTQINNCLSIPIFILYFQVIILNYNECCQNKFC